MTQVRTVDGRVAGRRGQATRARLLECLDEMLATTAYRDVTVIDVARLAGTSPATFYQYFPDIQAAVLELAGDVVKDAAGLKDLAADRSWAGRSGGTAAAELVDGFLDFWRDHDAILRVVDLAAAEGDRRFSRIRMKLLNIVVNALTDAIAELQRTGKVDGDVLPAATAGVLVTMLAASAAHTKAFESWSVKDGDLRAGLTRLVAWGVTGKKPVAA
jgi:AcrR family transcriptional regulator